MAWSNPFLDTYLKFRDQQDADAAKTKQALSVKERSDKAFKDFEDWLAEARTRYLNPPSALQRGSNAQQSGSQGQGQGQDNNNPLQDLISNGAKEAMGGVGGTGLASLPLANAGEMALANPYLLPGVTPELLGAGGAAGAAAAGGGLSSLPLAGANLSLVPGASFSGGGAAAGAGGLGVGGALAALAPIGAMVTMPWWAPRVTGAIGDTVGGLLEKLPGDSWTPFSNWDSYTYWLGNQPNAGPPTEEGYWEWEKMNSGTGGG